MLKGVRFALVLLIGIATAPLALARDEGSDAPVRAQAAWMKNGFVAQSLTIQGVRVQFVEETRSGITTIIAEGRDGSIVTLEAPPASGKGGAKEVGDSWEVVPIFANPSNGSGIYGVYRNGQFFGILTIQPNGTLTITQTSQP